jgi:nucleoside-diphosphate-sugar epimerase
VKVLVTGATGVLGRVVVTDLARQGHLVRGVARTPEKAAWLQAQGAEPVTVDLFDAAAVKDAVAGSEAVLHLATNIPELKEMRKPTAWETNNRLRTTCTRFLVDAALDHGVQTFVAESITFPYPDRGADWIDETVPFVDEPLIHSVIDLETEVTRFAQHGGRGIALRFGAFYGPEARSVDEFLGIARRGIAPYPGSPGAYMSSIHTDDAASAVVASLTVPSGNYNVVDEPMTRREVADAFANAFGLRRQHFVPRVLVRVTTGKAGDMLLRSQRVTNGRFVAASGWTPAHPNVVVGFADVASRRALRDE